MENGPTVVKHRLKVGTAEPALRTATSRGAQGDQVPTMGTGPWQKLGKQRLLADAPINDDYRLRRQIL